MLPKLFFQDLAFHGKTSEMDLENGMVHGSETVHESALEGFQLVEETGSEQTMEMECGRLQVVLSC